MTSPTVKIFVAAAFLAASSPLVSAQKPPQSNTANDNQDDAIRRANDLTQEARRAYRDGDPDRAISLMAEVLRLRRGALGIRDLEVIRTQSDYGTLLGLLNRPAEAEPLLEEVLRLRREVLGDRHPDTLKSINDYTRILQAQGRASEAEALYAESLELSRELLGDRDPATLTSISNYGIVLDILGRQTEAEPLFEEALRLRREVLGERHPDTLATLNDYTAVLRALGKNAAAEPLLADALRLLRDILGERDPATIRCLFEYAGVIRDLGRPAEAEPLLKEGLRLNQEVLGERHPDTIASLNTYGFVLQYLGRLDEAETYYSRALELNRAVNGVQHVSTIISLSNYAAITNALGRTAESEPLYAETLRLSREVLGERNPTTLTSLSNYASVLQELGRPAEAEPLFAEALRVRREVLGERDPATLGSMNNYAFVLSALDRREEAAQVHAEALNLYREVLGERHPNTIAALNNYGYILTELGRADEAEPAFAEALRLRREVLGDRHHETLTSIRNYSVALLKTGQAKRALPLARELSVAGRLRAVDLSNDNVRGAVQRDREIGDRQSVERLLADVLWENVAETATDQTGIQAEAFTALQLSSAGSTSRAVAEAAASRFASDLGLQALVQERQSLARSWSEIEAALVESQAGGETASADRDALRSGLAGVEARIREIDERLSAEAPQYFAILNQQSVGLEQIRAVLGEDEAILFLVPTPRGTHSMAITRDDISWARAAIDDDEIEVAIAEFRTGLEIRAGDPNLPLFDLEQAHELYAQLIAPVEPVLQGIKRVYVIADGDLSRLPLGTLLVSEPAAGADSDDPEVLRQSDWLADRYALVQLPSLQSLFYIRSFGSEASQGDGIGFTGFGAPVLTGGSRLRGARSATLEPVDAARLVSSIRGSNGMPLMEPDALRRLSALPGTQVELELVREALGASGNDVYLGERMTETAIRSATLSDTRILHLATHGFTSEESGSLAEPGLVFTPPATAQSEDDGYLAASEIVGLDLSSAEWVILSACNTASASGKPGETGLSGLAQAFFYAGAESLLVSHWPVFDDIAPILTLEALRRSQEGQSRAEALQAAMRTVRNDPDLDAAHPAVWAPFVLVGEGR